MPAPENMRRMLTGPNGANRSRMKSGSISFVEAWHSRSKNGIASVAYEPAHALRPIETNEGGVC